jgi:hypothetical protein
MADVPMLVRVDGPIVTEASMAQARSEVKLLSRLKHDHVLRMDFVSAVAGRVGSVYEHSGGASLSLLIAAEGAAGRSRSTRPRGSPRRRRASTTQVPSPATCCWSAPGARGSPGSSS